MEISNFWPFLLAVVVAIVGWLGIYYGFQIKVWKAIADQDKKLTQAISDAEDRGITRTTEIVNRLTKWETRLELIWKPIEARVIDMLKTYPSRIDKDVLMDKFYKRDISVEDAETLWTILCEEEKLTQDSNKRLFYGLLQSIVADGIRQQGEQHANDMVASTYSVSDQCGDRPRIYTQDSKNAQGAKD